MWCPHCESDVVSEISSDGRLLLCTHCGTAIQQVFVPSLHPETQAARELLERWSKQRQHEPVEETFALPVTEQVPAIDAEPTDARSTDAEPTDASEVTQVLDSDDEQPVVVPEARKPPREWRVDAAHEEHAGPRKQNKHSRRMNKMHSKPSRDSARRSDRSHNELPSPHFDMNAPAERPLPGKSESAWGQVLAYSGVGVLTVGTVFVVWGYFGGIESYASTGWLLSTAGQMLLLLGVVTLVSGGMQQTTHEVGQRIEYLNGRMYRIERSTQKILRGPHFGQRSRRHQTSEVGLADQDAE